MTELLFRIWGQGMAVGVAVTLFLGMVAALEAGWRFGGGTRARHPQQDTPGDNIISGAVLSLFGLLVAFTFSGAAGRFDHRRDLIVEETNAIGTAYLRLDLLPAPDHDHVSDLFRRYLDSRIEVYRRVPDMEAAKEVLAQGAKLQAEIWARSIDGCGRTPDTTCKILLLPALNVMIDITTTRTMAAEMHPPGIILVTLAILALFSAFLSGYAMGQQPRHLTHMFAFATLFSIAIFVIVDLEYPRLGLIRVDDFDRAMIELRQSMD